MAKTASKSAYSAGAREERREILAIVERLLARDPTNRALIKVEKAIQTRHKRYSKKKGGL